ncbi:uncharacterized protein PV09_08304 [Verruconis gallopava]|uniref:F-box domain-containing protein n=1 Tax=Verruconis gallopava TaxID=253628 RepID=A0A0D1YH31_9PEZI|nr:uncharacterized protein PV09_08304 [Verruconis gallopava]KIW00122.1 hypothetical protein PV09_08304 [Verruconis gallopava]
MKHQRIEELGEDDGMAELRARVHEINRRFNTHEERGAALRSLMMSRPKQAPSASSAWSSDTRPRPSKTAAVEPRLEALPVELVESIVLHLDLLDFGRFRQACSALQQKSLPFFTKAFFTTRTVRLNWPSMRHLALLQMQAHLGTAIKDLIVLVEEEGRFCASVSRTAMPLLRRTRDFACEAPYDANRLRQIETMLDRIFERLRSPLRSLTVRVTGSPRGASGGRGRMSNMALSVIFSALASSGVKVLKLSVGGRSADGAISSVYADTSLDGCEPLDAALLRESARLGRVLDRLTVLELCWSPIHRFGFADLADAGEQGSPTGFPNSLLRLAPNLEKLVLRGGQEGRGGAGHRGSVPSLERLVVPLPKLQALDLFTPAFLVEGGHLQILRQFKRRCCNRLEDVVLRGLTGVDASEVESARQMVRDALGLLRAEIQLDPSANVDDGSEDGDVEM